jgi:pimeloyl-ACP methyl ester carboxylesterase
VKEIFLSIEEKYVRLHEWGSDKNPIIICFHGLGSTSLSFIELGNLLSDKYHIFSIDLPGHGKTSQFGNEEDYKIPNLIKWADKVISHITEDKFFILAHSWGADVALHYITQYKSKVRKTMLLDGGCYSKNDYYAYGASKGWGIDSIEKEIDYYLKDFDDYCFNTLEEHIQVEKSNYIRWSELLERAANDLIRIENGKFKYHANGFTAAGIIKSMYYYQPNSIYDKLPGEIYLLQSTMPESRIEYRDMAGKKFEICTGARLKKINGAGHLIHWDKPNEVVAEILNWFK